MRSGIGAPDRCAAGVGATDPGAVCAAVRHAGGRARIGASANQHADESAVIACDRRASRLSAMRLPQRAASACPYSMTFGTR
ncbi:hypothetical protein D7S86_01155 [Pararobbsia silviterrae]|uniref:Uncharacterized protein n=1 Tax=Pararobbsia silviterrae TaxID=1792498 RepID=A0A494YE12_9BURK|nr:hypothetical protein D7S86_01155 [Pararobbsia silviterrae]